MYSFISSIISPLPVLLILIICFGIFYWRKKGKLTKIFSILCIFWFLVISTPLIPDIFIKNLERSYNPLSERILPDSSFNYRIMVLGAGHTNDFNLSVNDQLSKPAIGRLIEGIRLYRKIKGSKLMLSGWGFNQPISQAQMLAITAISLGVPANNIILFNKPENTRQEALEYAKTALPTDTLLLVTDATHMPRAMKLFMNTGVTPIPVPINHIFKNGAKKGYQYYFPSSNNIAKMEIAMHEYVGIFVSYFE